MIVPVEVYSRVVGYFRPVKNWNVGKTEEYKERKTAILKEDADEKRTTDIF